MRIVFAGTPEFAVASLGAAARHHEVVAVYTQPDRPAGRGRGLMPSPVKLDAIARGIPVFQPESLKTPEAQQQLRDLQPDLMVVVAYGLILPRAVLAIPTHGCWNVHASLLPRWRGAAPIQRALLAGDDETGVAIMQMDRGLDTGAIFRVEAVPITPATTAAELHDTLAALGARMMVDVLAGVAAGRLQAQPQSAEGATYAHKLERDEGRLDWTQPAAALERAVRALNPWPGVWFEHASERIRVLAAAVDAPTTLPPGTVIDDRLTIACGEGSLRLCKLQRAGRAPMPTDALLRGYPLPAGTRFR